MHPFNCYLLSLILTRFLRLSSLLILLFVNVWHELLCFLAVMDGKNQNLRIVCHLDRKSKSQTSS